MSQYTRLIIALAVLLGIAGTFILYLSWPSLTGQTIVLATRPVDPFDILRGQYIVINYEISRVNLSSGAKEGDSVYVSLKEGDDKLWHADKVSLSKPDSGIFIRGTAKQSWQGFGVEYGIEQYFFERNAELPRTNLTVEVKVSSSGQARIKQLLYNGKPVKIEYQKPSLTS